MATLTGKDMVKYAKNKVGTPYVFGAKLLDGKLTKTRLNALRSAYPSMFTTTYYNKAVKYVGKVCTDCSGLVCGYFKWNYGTAQLYKKASSVHKLNKNDLTNVPKGAVLYKEGHVGVYNGDGTVTEALGINYGTVVNKVASRSFTHYLLFKEVEYDVISAVKEKESNPYKKPTKLLKKGSKAAGVKWIQFELRESGYKIKMTGVFDEATEKATKKFQKSCKIPVTGQVDTVTRNKLILK